MHEETTNSWRKNTWNIGELCSTHKSRFVLWISGMSKSLNASNSEVFKQENKRLWKVWMAVNPGELYNDVQG